VLGDSTYGAQQNRRFKELMNFIPPRQLLHAQQLAFIHPRHGRPQTFQAAYPADFVDALKHLRRARS
jgi:23S rRNA-/tRNA-specific pseudouridylate synthase